MEVRHCHHQYTPFYQTLLLLFPQIDIGWKKSCAVGEPGDCASAMDTGDVLDGSHVPDTRGGNIAFKPLKCIKQLSMS